ncbi:pol Retrovirus-related Pol polyprotein from transposon-like 8 [Homarus americanus]|uniref:Pol Retrovirus-related Pol polyprotein from transposon-like 8 n=1 Tax=Homarus americanus TaxID=6706 RepID=A0A8J5JT06_HOMAM|nr:pol Retrovirus-related Pol polyprotein from transposon-like 8 [Homarus americanus]
MTYTSTFNDLVNLVVCEEFKKRIPFNIMGNLEDKGEKDLMKQAQLADRCELVHRFKGENKNPNIVKSPSGQNLGTKATITYLGHIVGQGRCRPKTVNVDAILNVAVSITCKSLMGFLGMAGYYRRYGKNFASVAAPLTSLTSGKVPF